MRVDDARVHHLRLALAGTSAAIAVAAADPALAGAAALTGPNLVLARPDPVDLEALSLRHPAVRFGAERFEALGDGIVREVVAGGDSTVLDHELLECDCESGDEGEPLEAAVLRPAAQRVADVPVDSGPG